MNSPYVKYPPASPPTPQISIRWGDILSWFNTKRHHVLLLLLLILNLSVFYIYQNHLFDLFIAEHVSLFSKSPELHKQLFSISDWGYIIIASITILRLTILTSIFQIPLLLQGHDIGFRKMFSVQVKAAFVMTAAEFVRIIRIVYEGFSIKSFAVIQNTPFGILDLLQADFYSQASIRFLNQFNLFELIWCITVYLGLTRIKKICHLDAFLMVISVWSLITLLYWGIAVYTEAMIQ